MEVLLCGAAVSCTLSPIYPYLSNLLQTIKSDYISGFLGSDKHYMPTRRSPFKSTYKCIVLRSSTEPLSEEFSLPFRLLQSILGGGRCDGHDRLGLGVPVTVDARRGLETDLEMSMSSFNHLRLIL